MSSEICAQIRLECLKLAKEVCGQYGDTAGVIAMAEAFASWALWGLPPTTVAAQAAV